MLILLLRKVLSLKAGSIIFQNNSISSSYISGLFSTSNNNTFSGSQTFSGGIVVNGSTTNLSTNTTIGTNSTNTLTVNASPDFKNGLTVSYGTVSVPNNAISLSAVNGLNTKITSPKIKDLSKDLVILKQSLAKKLKDIFKEGDKSWALKFLSS